MSTEASRRPWPVRGVLVLLAAWGVASVAGRLLADDGEALHAPFAANVGVTMGGIAGVLVLLRAATDTRCRAGWANVGAGIAVWTVADVLTLSSGAVGVTAAPAFRLTYVAAVLLMGAGLLAVVRHRHPRTDRSVRLDALTTALAVAALVTWLGVDPVRGTIGPDAPPFTAAVLVTLIGVEGLIIVLVVTGCVLLRWRPDRTWTLATLAAMAFVIAEAGFALGSADGTWTPASMTNVGWSGAFILLAWSAWSPRRAHDDVAARGELRDVLLPFVFALASIVLLAASEPLDVGVAPTVLAAGSLVVGLVRLLLTALEHGALLRASQVEARTDALTGLGNRRQLTDDLDAALADPVEGAALVLFDLDGFKGYNDDHGHPAGDALLIALGGALAAEVGIGRAYRLGGDEFCALVAGPEDELDAVVAGAANALAMAAVGAGIGSSHGAVHLHAEAREPEAALRIADRRLYGEKARRGRGRRRLRDVV